MTRLSWGLAGERYYEAGVDRGVLYPRTSPGVPWNGLIAVNQKSNASAPTPYYQDGVKYFTSQTLDDFSATLEAYTYPDEFEELDGNHAQGDGLFITSQPRKFFDLSYRTKIGNDLKGLEEGYKIHLVFNALATPSDQSYRSVGESPDLTTFSWDISTVPAQIPGYRPTAHLVVDSTKTSYGLMRAIEDMIYGSDNTSPYLPPAAEIVAMFNEWELLVIEPNALTGLSTLSVGGNDLDWTEKPGLYEAPPETRLVETSTPGLYTLEG